nr:hypothetical protein [Tanacetum cinerariifolium]
MADLAFTPQHNMISYLEKTEGNVEFHQIVDFLTSSFIHHSLTIHAIVDGKTVVITESSVRRDLLFTDANGITCLANEQIFENLLLMSNMIRQSEKIYGTVTPLFATMLAQPAMVEGGAMAQIRSEGALIQSIDPPLSTGIDGFVYHFVTKVLDLENIKTAQAKEIASLKKRVIKLEQRQSLRLSGFHPFRADEDADTEMIVKDNGNGEKEGSTAEIVSIARPDISAARPELSTAESKTPPTTTTLFDDEYVTIANTLKSKKIDQDQIERDAKVALKTQAHLNEEAMIERERQEEASKAGLAEMYDELKFNSHKDAKTLMEAIEKRFGGKTETKKVQKTLLKQQYENFTGSSSESLDQIHDRLQKLVSQLEIHGVSLYQKDVNLKFLCSLPSEWKTQLHSQYDKPTDDFRKSQFDVISYQTGTFMPPKPDLVFHTVPIAVETDHSGFTVQLSPSKPAQDLSHTNRPTAPIIENWVSDSEDEFETKVVQIVPSFVQSSEQVKTPMHSIQPVETSIPATTPKPTSPKSNSSGKRRNRKAYFVCKSVDHLIKDCDYHAKKMAQPTPRNYAHWGNHKQYASLTHPKPLWKSFT